MRSLALIYHEALLQLATARRYQGAYAEAEALYQTALLMAEETLGTDDPAVGGNHNFLGMLYKYWGKYELAEPHYRRAQAILGTSTTLPGSGRGGLG